MDVIVDIVVGFASIITSLGGGGIGCEEHQEDIQVDATVCGFCKLLR